jgi:O-antigen ligase
MLVNKNSLIHIIVFLFPALVATVSHGGSSIYALLLLVGLALGWPAWRSLEAWEKRLLTGFILFFLLVCISLLNTEDMSNGIKKIGRYIAFPLMIPMYLLLKKYQLETGKAFLYGLLLASMVLLGQGIYQTTVLNWPGAQGAYNTIVFGNIAMLVAVILAAALFTLAQNRWHYLAGALALAMALFAAVLSVTQGAWLLFPFLLLLFLWLKRNSLKIIPSVSIVIMVPLLIWGVFSVDKVNSRVTTTVIGFQAYLADPSSSGAMGSAGARLEMWRNSVTIWRTQPLIGTGIGDYGLDVLQLIKDGDSHLSRGFGHAHNIYFDVLATAGLVGLLAMLVFMQIIPFHIFYSFWIKEQDPWLKFYALSGMTTILAFAVFGLTEGWLARNVFVRTYVMCILVFMSSIAVRKAGKEVVSRKS